MGGSLLFEIGTHGNMEKLNSLGPKKKINPLLETFSQLKQNQKKDTA